MPGYRVKEKKENGRARVAIDIISEMRRCIVIVEGLRDAKAAEEFGITALTIDRVRSDGSELKNYGKIYAFADIDESGKRKQEQIVRMLDEKGIEIPLDSTSGPRLLEITGVKCVEEMVKPLRNILRQV